MSNEFDVIVLGAGPNGLTSAAYLARASARVAVVERNIETGGGLVTQEIAGFKMNYHATYMMLGELMPPYADLELGGEGVRFTYPEAQVSFLFENKKSFTLFRDAKRSAASVAELSAEDAEPYAKLRDEVDRMCDDILIPATFAPPVEPVEQMLLFREAGPLGERMADISEMTPLEYIESFGFRDTRVKGGLIYLTAMFGLDVEEGGMGFMAPIYLSRLTQSALVRGGSHQLSSVLRRRIEEAGGSIVVGNGAKKLLVKGGRAAGVALEDGTVLEARAIVSTLNPEQTFLQLLDSRDVPQEVREGAENYEWEKWSLFVANWGVLCDPPRYEGYPGVVDKSLITVMGHESAEDVLAHMNEVKAGNYSRLAGHGTVSSLFDPLTVPGHVSYGTPHTLRWECWAPYDVPWEREKEKYAAKLFQLWTKYAPNLEKANVRASVAWSPKDIEAQLTTMKQGSIKHGAYTSLQMGYNRPFPECSSYRTPIGGLYVAGSSVHPGGMVIMGPGYNAARPVAEDLGLKIWWREAETVTKARKAGYLPALEQAASSPGGSR